MAWKTIGNPQRLTDAPATPDMDALTCWVARLMPLTEAEPGRVIHVVLCNRSGEEKDATYSGTSTVLRFKDGEVHAYAILGGSENGLLVVDTSKDPSDPKAGGFKLWPRPEEYKGWEEQVGEFSYGAGRPPTEVRSQQTPYGECSSAQEYLAKCTPDDEGTLSKKDAMLQRRDRCLNMPPQSVVATKKQARPKLLIPDSPSEPLREMSTGECRAGVSAVPRTNSTTRGVRSPTASTPYPHGSHNHWPSSHRHWRITPRTTTAVVPATPMTAFEDPTTAISASPQCWNGQWSSSTPGSGSLYSAGQSASVGTTVAYSNSSTGRDPEEFERS